MACLLSTLWTGQYLLRAARECIVLMYTGGLCVIPPKFSAQTFWKDFDDFGYVASCSHAGM